MNEQMIEMYKGVQGFRGDWRIGDPVCSCIVKECGFVSNLRPDGDIDVQFTSGWTCDFCKDDPSLLWLPPPTPRWPGDDEKRTLWGMVDWKRCYISIGHDGRVSLYFWHNWGTIDAKKMFVKEFASLPEALLRAIAKEG